MRTPAAIANRRAIVLVAKKWEFTVLRNEFNEFGPGKVPPKPCIPPLPVGALYRANGPAAFALKRFSSFLAAYQWIKAYAG
jgi:hypothetical protein